MDFVCEDKVCGHIVIDEVFKIDKEKRVQLIYGTKSSEHLGVRDTKKRLGNYSICGEFKINFEDTKEYKNTVNKIIQRTGAKKISSMMVSGKPFHRVHERLIRTALCSVI